MFLKEVIAFKEGGLKVIILVFQIIFPNTSYLCKINGIGKAGLYFLGEVYPNIIQNSTKNISLYFLEIQKLGDRVYLISARSIL
jgi:hypothetical protein